MDSANRPSRAPALSRTWSHYVAAIAISAAATLLAAIMFGRSDLADVVMLHLLAVLVISLRLGYGPSLVAILLGVLSLDFFFAPPIYSLAVSDVRHVVTFGVMLLVALAITGVTRKVRLEASKAREREHQTALLYALNRDLGRVAEPSELAAAAARHIERVVDAHVVVLTPGRDGELATLYATREDSARARSDSEGIRLAWSTGRPVGRGTRVLPDDPGLFVPLSSSGKSLGVIGVFSVDAERLDGEDQRDFVHAVAGHLSISLDRIRLEEERKRAELRAQTERLRSTLLSSVSHDLRTPLGIITGAATTILDESTALETDVQLELLRTIDEEARRLDRLIANLLYMTKLESSEVAVKKEWIPIDEVVGAALTRLEDRLSGRAVVTRVTNDLVAMDGVLVEQLLYNLVENALKYSPPAAPLEIAAAPDDGVMAVEVSDRGPGLRPGDEQRVFEKFYRSPHEGTTDGAGLGLAIASAIALVHGGRLVARNREGGGASFRLELPMDAPAPPMVPDNAAESSGAST